VSRANRIAEYIERQYITEVGTPRENAEALFSDDLVYHVNGRTLTRDDVVTAVTAVRESPRDGRQVESSRFEEEGNTVHWHLSAKLPGMGPDGGEERQESDLRAVFNADDQIQEVWSEPSISD